MLNNSNQTKTMNTKRYFAGAAITLLLASSASVAPLHAQGRGRGMGSGMTSGRMTGGMTGGMRMGGMTPPTRMGGMPPGGMTPPTRMGGMPPGGMRMLPGRGPGTDVVRNGWRGGDRVRVGTETIYSSGVAVGYPAVDVAPVYAAPVYPAPVYQTPVYAQPVVDPTPVYAQPVVEAPLVYAAPVVVGVGVSSGFVVGHHHVGRVIERTTIIRRRR